MIDVPIENVKSPVDTPNEERERVFNRYRVRRVLGSIRELSTNGFSSSSKNQYPWKGVHSLDDSDHVLFILTVAYFNLGSCPKRPLLHSNVVLAF